MHILVVVLYEWDPAKAQGNLRKHGIDFADAAIVLEDPMALSMQDTSSDEEERWVAVGMDPFGRVLVVVYTWRGESIRLISARPANARERALYEELP